jgi:hypothetical protein
VSSCIELLPAPRSGAFICLKRRSGCGKCVLRCVWLLSAPLRARQVLVQPFLASFGAVQGAASASSDVFSCFQPRSGRGIKVRCQLYFNGFGTVQGAVGAWSGACVQSVFTSS